MAMEAARRCLLALAVLVGATGWLSANSGETFAQESSAPKPAPIDPAQFITSLANGALESIARADGGLAEKQQRFRQLLVTNFDVPRIARFTLGRYWNEATPDQRTEFAKLLEDYLVLTYASRFNDYRGSSFRPVGVRSDDQGTIVLTELLREDGGPVKVGWRIEAGNTSLRVIDVYIENVSMALTQRSDFASVIQRGGGRVDDLLAAIRAKVGTASRS